MKNGGVSLDEAGVQLIEAKKECKERGENWLSWVEREFGWSRPTADRLIQIAEAFSNCSHVSSLPALDIPMRALVMRALVALSKPSVPTA
jgi:hypothetical protein